MTVIKKQSDASCLPVFYDFTILRIPLNTKAYTLQKNCERQDTEEAFSDLKQDP